MKLIYYRTSGPTWSLFVILNETYSFYANHKMKPRWAHLSKIQQYGESRFFSHPIVMKTVNLNGMENSITFLLMKKIKTTTYTDFYIVFPGKLTLRLPLTRNAGLLYHSISINNIPCTSISPICLRSNFAMF